MTQATLNTTEEISNQELVESILAKTKTPKTKKAAVIPAPVIVPVTPATKSKIDTKALVGNNFEIKIMGTCTKFTGTSKHAYVKGTTLELSDSTVSALTDRMEIISKETAAKYHLGKSKAFVRKLNDTADLQAVLDIYFK